MFEQSEVRLLGLGLGLGLANPNHNDNPNHVALMSGTRPCSSSVSEATQGCSGLGLGLGVRG